MESDLLVAFSAALVAITSFSLLIINDWRVKVTFLSAQYVGVFFLVAESWALPLALIKLIAGWMAAALLGVTAAGGLKELNNETLGNSEKRVHFKDFLPVIRVFFKSRVFSIFAALAVIFMGLSINLNVSQGIPGLSNVQASGGLILIGMGLLSLSFYNKVLPTFLGLLTALSGFEIIFAAMEASILVAGMLAIVNIALASAGAYLLLSPQMEKNL